MRKLQIYPTKFELSAEVTEMKLYEKKAKVEIRWADGEEEDGDTFRITLTPIKAARLAAWLQELSIVLSKGAKK